MAQFDVHRNTGANSSSIPFVVVLHPLEMVSVPVERLGARVASLAGEGDRIIGALDELLSRVHY